VVCLLDCGYRNADCGGKTGIRAQKKAMGGLLFYGGNG
jgi:hypothetical protein